MKNGKRRKKNFFYYLNYRNLLGELEKYHATISVKQTLLGYAGYVGVCGALGAYLRLDLWAMVLVALAGVFCVPRLMIHTCKNAYEQRRFSDISQYMQQLLYSFRGTGKIKLSLEDVRQLYEPGNPLVECINRALDILNSPEEGEDAPKIALAEIEKEYACEKLQTIHRFIIRVEETGGVYDKTIQLLLEDRANWVERVSLSQAAKKKQKRNVILSILVTIAMSGLLTNLMPMEIDITRSMAYQVIAVLMLILDELIYVSTNRKLATNWLGQKEITSDDVVLRRYRYVMDYHPAKEQKKSLFLSLPFWGMAVFGYVFHLKMVVAVGSTIGIVMLFQHRLNWYLAQRGLKREILLKFPRWLMDLALLLQTTNVQMALFQSISTAPAVLVPELEILKDKLLRDPISAKPYMEFYEKIKIPEVQSSMKMLYALSQGAGGDFQSQIAEIIARNNKMLDKAEQEADENQQASMYVDFLLPQLSAGALVMADMVLYIVMYLPQMSVG